MLTGVHVPGNSLLHRARPGVKIAALLALTSVLVAAAHPVVLAAGAVVVVVAGLAAGLGVRGLWRLARPMRWIVLLLLPVQWWTLGPQQAVVLVGGLVVTVVAAGVVTATTRVDDMLDTLAWALRPLRRLGVDPDRVALLFALVVRAVPVIAGLVETAREARRARGLDRSLRALLVPVVVRAVRHAQGVGDALVARGFDD